VELNKTIGENNRMKEERYQELLRTSEGGINWSWLSERLNEQEANEFLSMHKGEHRGKYPNDDSTFSIRWR
jgi:hypothetical protein